MKIIFPEYIDNLSEEHRNQIKHLGDVTFYNDIPDEDELIKRLQGAQITAFKWVNLTKKCLSVLPELKYLITLSAGYGHLPLKAMTENAIRGINCPTHNSLAVAEHTIAMVLLFQNRLLKHKRSSAKAYGKRLFMNF